MLCRCLGRPCTSARRPAAASSGLELAPRGLDAGLARGARLVEQPRDAPVLVGLQEAERQVLQLPLDLPDAQPVGQRREHLLRSQRQRLRAVGPAEREPAQRLQPRGQPQQHHAQVAREGQQHLAHAFGLQRALRGADLRVARRALRLHQLARGAHQARVRGAEGLGHHLLRALQVVACIDQVGRGAHRRRGADGLQDGRHAIGVGERVLAGVQWLSGQQRLGKGASLGQRRGAAAVGCRGVVGVVPGKAGVSELDDRHPGRRVGARRSGSHGPSRNSRTTCR
jgi:hypothetical protein